MNDITDNMKKFDALTDVLMRPNSHAVGVMKLLDKHYPAFARKVFEKNPLIEKMAMANFCSMDILMYPICGHCESLAAYCRYAQNAQGFPLLDQDKKPVGVCRCLKCGRETVAPITFYEWCLMELKKKAPESIGMNLQTVVDIIAERGLENAKRRYRKVKVKEYVQP
ncbi:MAG: hypothetical protein WCY09_10085 [Candidatus Omnitrophota bacterium]|jgi:hypothetical protein